eukprot:CAMPEP_0201596054 /NCGR_PEP_ID=MMETSP0190_2-20130828/192861_1 /ASSEMBLY_ACC=CAM_ASM_000263 /TAXON_ID=37353 /ORGANISM="Rosalina sp." /LENGTH=477 /DNA_ID=CAMNT_0048056263 /DNA_START=480 /DNA_END=1913 /DNA_ORIENTATION=+
MELVNACWTGQSIIELYGLDTYLNWDDLRFGVKRELSGRAQQALYFDQLVVFKAELETLSPDEFTIYVDEFIDKANELGNYCGCGAANISFSRLNLVNPIDQCTQDNTYWDNTRQIDNGECINRFINASYAVQAELELFNVTSLAIYNLQQDALNVFKTYDVHIYPLGLELYNNLENLSCTVDPLFDAIDELVFNFSNCGFIGEFYGNIKEDGCVVLFNQTYYIARALCVIAFMSIIMVFFSYCMDYVYGPPALKRKSDDTKQSYDEIPIDEENNDNNINGNNDNTDDVINGRNEPGGTAATVELIGSKQSRNTTSDNHTIADDSESEDTAQPGTGDNNDNNNKQQPSYNYHYHNDKPSPQPQPLQNNAAAAPPNEARMNDTEIIYENNEFADDNDNDSSAEDNGDQINIEQEETDRGNMDRTNITHSEDVKIEKDSTNESDIVRVATEDTNNSVNFDPKAVYNYPILNMDSHIDEK